MSGGGGRKGRRGHGGGGHGSSERWLISYADFITLLLVFFIVLYSMSKIDQNKYDALKAALASSMTVVNLKGANGQADPSVLNGTQGVLPAMDALIQLEQVEFEKMKEDIQKVAEEEGVEEEVQTTLDREGLTVSISNAGFFEAGEAVLRGEMVQTLDRLARMFKAQEHDLRIEGHTDNIPIRTAQYPSNWELSACRATALVRFLIERHGYDPRRLSALGYGEYDPKVANDTEAHRAENRRVDIVVLRRDAPATRDR
jgi:chemotaxis protein MotB